MTLAKAEENLETKNPLPQGWRWIRLGEVCEFAYGSSLPEIGRNKGTIPVYGSNGVVGYHDEPVAQGPTLIIGRKGSIGEVNYSSGPCWPIDTTYYVDSSKTSCDLRWLFFLLKFIKLNALNKASGVPGLNRNDAYNQLIPLPSTLAEQERIARILNEQMAVVEKARTAAEARLEAAKALPAAYMQAAFESLEARDWRWIKLGEVCKFINGDAYKESDWSTSGVPIIRIQNLNDRSKPFNYWQGPLSDRVKVSPGDLLLAWSGTPGTSFGAHIWDSEPAVLNQHIFRVDIDPDRGYPMFILHAINRQLDVLINRAHGGVGLRHVTRKEVDTLEIALPPLAEQKRIALILSNQFAGAERVVQKIQQEVETINALPAALLRRAFTGGL